jgi:predicted TIM-barrel fold metal-dependent hydrolase
MSVENGVGWVAPLLKRLDKIAFSTRGFGGLVEGRPSETFKRNFYLCPFFEEDPIEIAELMGYDKVLFGSDWSHPEGLDEPLKFADTVVDRANQTDARKIMRSNIAELIGLKP